MGAGHRAGAGFTAMALAFGLLAVTASAAQAATDLNSLLAPAPTVDWIEAGATPTVLDGEFTAHTYAAYLQAVGTKTTTTESTLNLYGFQDGFAKEWEQRGTQDLLIERVFEFRDSRGAGFWYAELKLEAQTYTEYTGDIPGATTIPNSFGVVLTVKSTGERNCRVEFVKGNLVFVVHTDAFTDDLAAMTVTQAGTEYGSAPIAAANPVATSNSRTPTWVTAAAIAGFTVIALIAIAIVVIFFIVGRRRQSPATGALSAVQMSADGVYWWDGTQWRDAAREVPPAARRSPDGGYWWDGKTWRTVARW
jgi:hypothetical protein